MPYLCSGAVTFPGRGGNSSPRAVKFVQEDCQGCIHPDIFLGGGSRTWQPDEGRLDGMVRKMPLR
jgi:hypothetical protein